MKRKSADIFVRPDVTPNRLKAVAGQRLGDAQCLCNSRLNARANGAMYLGGFAIECLLKALLLRKHPWLGQPPKGAESRENAQLRNLAYRSHDLEELLNRLAEVDSDLCEASPRLAASLRQICSEWSIFARYSPRRALIGDADHFVERVREIKQWLERRL